MPTGDAPTDTPEQAAPVAAAAAAKPRYPGVLASLIIIFFGWIFMTKLMAYTLEDATGYQWEYMYLIARFTVAGIVAYLYYVFQPARGEAEYFALQRMPWQAAIRVPIFYFSAFIFTAALGVIIFRTLRTVGVSEETLARSPSSNAAPDLPRLLSALVVAPFCEELIMRGLVLQGLLQRYKPVPAVLLSAAIFGIYHGSVHQGISAFLGGCVLGWVFFQTRSLWVTILMHFSHNAIVAMARGLRAAYRSSLSVPSRESTAPIGGSDTVWELFLFYGVWLLIAWGNWLLLRSCYRTFQQEFFRSNLVVASGTWAEAELELPLTEFKSRRASPPSEPG